MTFAARYFEAPQPVPAHCGAHTGSPTVFLAGGISGVPDWQRDAAVALLDWHAGVVVLNPRRGDFSIGDSRAGARDQVVWEQQQLHRVDVTLFWFPACTPGTTVQPIALFELGQALGEGRRIVVGADPGYPRAFDVAVQCELNQPGLVVHDRLDAVVDAALVSVAALAHCHCD